MFERLIQSFGQPAEQQSCAATDPELQLAAAMLLFSVLAVDYRVTPHEATALRHSLNALFNLSPEKCQRLISRAASAHAKDATIVAATTLLKRRTTEQFRRKLFAEIHTIMHADGVLHHNELDFELRVERLLGLTSTQLLRTG